MIDTTSGPIRLAASWWILVIRGVLAVAFGVLAFVYPISALHAFVLLFGAFSIANGLFALVAAVQWHRPDTGRWWYTIAQAVLGIAVGIVTFVEPNITLYALAFLIAFWAILSGVMEIASGRRMRAHVPGEMFLVIAGLASILLGIVFLLEPRLPLLFVTFSIAAYAVVAGVSLIIIGSRLRGIHTSGGAGLR